MFLLRYRNQSGSLGEQEMLWEHEPTGECFCRFSEFSQTFTSVSIVNSIATQRTCLFLLDNSMPEKKKKHLFPLIIEM